MAALTEEQKREIGQVGVQDSLQCNMHTFTYELGRAITDGSTSSLDFMATKSAKISRRSSRIITLGTHRVLAAGVPRSHGRNRPNLQQCDLVQAERTKWVAASRGIATQLTFPETIISGIAQVHRLVHELQALAKDAGHARPLMIGIDQENGELRSHRRPGPIISSDERLGLVSAFSAIASGEAGTQLWVYRL